jgi:hypothetical protein
MCVHVMGDRAAEPTMYVDAHVHVCAMAVHGCQMLLDCYNPQHSACVHSVSTHAVQAFPYAASHCRIC